MGTELEFTVRSRLEELRQEAGFPGGMAAFLLPSGELGRVAVGLADVERQEPMTVERRILSGSIGKTFAAATVLGLSLEGKLGLDDPLERWLGAQDWYTRLPNAGDITLRMLLTHSAGLPDYVSDERFAQAAHTWLKEAIEKDPDYYLKPRELVAFALDKEPLFPADQGYAYSDIGYLLLGMVIEQASQSSYYEELERRFLSPLELRLTGPADRRLLPGLVAGYVDPENPLGVPGKIAEDGVMMLNPALEWTGGGLVTNPGDLARWASALYEGRALNGPYVDKLLTGVPAPAEGGTYGLGVIIRETTHGTAYGHAGWFQGYLSIVAYYPAHRLAMAVQVNTDAGQDIHGHLDALAALVIPACH